MSSGYRPVVGCGSTAPLPPISPQKGRDPNRAIRHHRGLRKPGKNPASDYAPERDERKMFMPPIYDPRRWS